MKPWPTKKLGDIVDILDNLRKPVTRRDRNSGSYPYYGATGIQDYVDEYIFDEELILVGEDGARWNAGDNSAYKISGKSWVNNHAHVLRPHRSAVIDNWIVYFLNLSDLSQYITGTTVKKLNQERLRSIEIPLPPLSEQKKIVARVEKLLAKMKEAKRLRAEARAATRSLLSAELHKIFEEGKKKGWEEREFGSVVEFKTKRNLNANLPYIGMEDIESNSGRFLGSLEPRKVKSTTNYFDESCLLYGKLRPYLNKVFLPNFEGHCTTEFIPICVHEKLLTRKWLRYWISNKEIVERISKTSAGARMPRANLKEVSKFKIPLPSLVEQKKIVARLDKLSAKLKKLEEHQKSADLDLARLEQSILHQAFQGK